jgi:protein O-GlcNAc transferase
MTAAPGRHRCVSAIAWGSALLLALACAERGGRAPEGSDAARSYIDRGDIALTFGRLDEAETAYRAALELSPSDVAARRGLSRTLAARGDFEGAVASYAELSPEALAEVRVTEHCPLLLRASEAALEVGDSALALERVRAAEAEGCEAPGLRPMLARASIAEAERVRPLDRAAAIDLYLGAVRSDPGNADAYRAAALLLLEEGRRRETLVLLSEALEHHPEHESLRGLMFEVLGHTRDDP